MLDLLFALAALAFFVVCILYIYGCDWFIKDDNRRATTERIDTTREVEQAGAGS